MPTKAERTDTPVSDKLTRTQLSAILLVWLHTVLEGEWETPEEWETDKQHMTIRVNTKGFLAAVVASIAPTDKIVAEITRSPEVFETRLRETGDAVGLLGMRLTFEAQAKAAARGMKAILDTILEDESDGDA